MLQNKPMYNAGGIHVTQLMAQQSGLNSVEVMWSAPSPPLPRGYQVIVANTNYNVTGTSHTLFIPQPGIHVIKVIPLPESRHLPDQAMSVQVTVKSEFGYMTSCTDNVFFSK